MKNVASKSNFPLDIACWFPCFVDSYSKWIRQKFYQFFINKKLKKSFYFFTCILPNYVALEITKEFWKNSQFENMLTGFLLRCQNSLRWEICLICHWNLKCWFMEAKVVFWICYGPKKWPKNHLDTTQTTFSKGNNY